MKSHARGFLPLVRALLFDCARKCQASVVDAERDLITITSRCEDEGLSFLTITLPEFGKAFDASLSKAQVDHSEFPGWKFQKRLPAFLRGFVSLVFHSTTGELRDEPSIKAIEAIRQICLSFKKLGLPCSSHREKQAIDGYIKTERILESAVFADEDLDLFGKVSHLLWGNMFDDFDHHTLFPKHGPGAVVERYTQNSKYNVKRWHARLEPFFPVDEYGFCNINHFEDEKDQLDVAPEEEESPVRVVLVPKTLKTPRVIAIEPACQQMTQQALKAYLVGKLEHHWLTRGHVNFTDQTINQRLAMTSSLDRKLATLDLSEASDRVHGRLVKEMLKYSPDLLGCLLASRSRNAKLPDDSVLSLSKFASMGSAVCFPIEAMVFFTIIVATLLKTDKLSVTLRNIYDVSRNVFVYGDDLILPTDKASVVSDSLSRYNCKVNVSKSFSQGYFRESCGVDAYMGHLVTPTYVRSTWPETRRDASQIISLVATGNQFYLRGFIQSGDYIRKFVDRLVGPLPVVQETCSGLGWIHPLELSRNVTRFNKKLQREEVYTLVPQPVYAPDPLDGWPALFKFFLSHGPDSSTELMFHGPLLGLAPYRKLSKEFDIRPVDKKHLERTPRHGAVGTQRQWVTPY